MDKWSNEKKEKVINCIYSVKTRNENETSQFSVASFYDDNLTKYLNNKNNQIIQGSRGTGKTHILRVLEQKMEDEYTCCIFLDCRKIGSSGSCGLDDNKPNPSRFFQHFLEEIQENLYRYYKTYLFDSKEMKKKAFSLLMELKAAVIASNNEVNKVTRSVSNNIDSKSDNKTGSQIELPFSLRLNKEKGTYSGKTHSENLTQDITVRKSIYFSNYSRILSDLLYLTGKNLIILLDEWSSIPLNIQPVFAEFLRRILFSINEVKFKIAVVPYRQRFRGEQNGNPIGLELGADIFVALDLDRRYSVDSSPEDIVVFCFRFFCQHLSSFLNETITPDEYLDNMFFSSDDALVLVRAAEGNPRDFIHLTFLCLQSLQSELSMDPIIDRRTIIKSSKNYFETSQLSNCNEESRDLLGKLIQFVVYNNENRGFLIDKKYLDFRPWKSLIDQRVLHVLDNNYFDYFSDQSLRAILIINFGAYCDILLNRKTVNFFYSGDFFEVRIFQKIPYRIEKKILPYSNGRYFYRCSIENNNLLFAPYLSNGRNQI